MSDIREAFRAFNRRVTKEGRVEEYKALYQRLLLEGRVKSLPQARYTAARKYYPLDGSAHELLFFDDPDGTIRVEPSNGRRTKQGHGSKMFVTVAADPALAHVAPLIEAVDKRRTATGHEAMQWVFNSMLTPWDQIDANEVPSIGALGYLRWARSDPKNEAAFYQMWSRMLEKKSLVDEENRRRDDGRKTFPLLEQFERSLEPNEEAA